MDEAVAFYKRLVWKLQLVYGHVGAAVEIEPGVQNEIENELAERAGGAGGPVAGGPGRATSQADCRAACHRCLVYLGDLSRYQSQVQGHTTRAIACLQYIFTVYSIICFNLLICYKFCMCWWLTSFDGGYIHQGSWGWERLA